MTHESATTVRELPEALPSGEQILLQCAPAWLSLYRRAFHARSLALYFGLLVALRGCNVLWDGGSASSALVAMLWVAIAAAFCLGMLAVLAWLTARATWYTITSRRIVMRMGIVLEVTFNFPFTVIDQVALHVYPNGTGDLALSFMDGEQIAYAHLWPHVRPWRLKRTEPMLRCVPDARAVATMLSNAMTHRIKNNVLPIRLPRPVVDPEQVDRAPNLGASESAVA